MCGFSWWSFLAGVLTFCAVCGFGTILMFILNGWNAEERIE